MRTKTDAVATGDSPGAGQMPKTFWWSKEFRELRKTQIPDNLTDAPPVGWSLAQRNKAPNSRSDV